MQAIVHAWLAAVLSPDRHISCCKPFTQDGCEEETADGCEEETADSMDDEYRCLPLTNTVSSVLLSVGDCLHKPW